MHLNNTHQSDVTSGRPADGSEDVPTVSETSGTDGHDPDAATDGDQPARSLWLAYLLALPPLGVFGAHNYYLGRKRMAVIYSCTAGLLLYGWLVDLIRMYWLVRRVNRVTKASGKVKDPIYSDDAYMSWFPLGLLGVHQFYLLRTKLGVIYLLTLGFMGIGWLIDGFRMPGLAERADAKHDSDEEVGQHTAGGEFAHMSQGTYTHRRTDENYLYSVTTGEGQIFTVSLEGVRLGRFARRLPDRGPRIGLYIATRPSCAQDDSIREHDVPSYDDVMEATSTFSPNNAEQPSGPTDTSAVTMSDIAPPHYSDLPVENVDPSSLPPPPTYDSLQHQMST